jgi:DNA primase
MAFSRLNLGNTEAIAPDSENSLIPESLLKDITSKYKKVFVLFDNDEPGIKSMKKYKERYGFDYVVLDMEKDLSDSVKKYGLVKTRETLLPLLKELCI